MRNKHNLKKIMKEIVLEREKLIGAIKVIDGLFMGDILASQDLEFINMNEVNYVVNTSIELPNNFESYGIEYLNLNWTQNTQSPLFKSFSEFEKSYKFVKSKLDNKECVLVVSTYGKNRCCTFLTLYLMMRFRWSFGMTVQFIKSRRYDIKIKKVFKEGIKDIQKDLVSYGRGALTYQWGVPSNKNDPEEVLVMHTYLNTLLRQNSSNLGVIVERTDLEESGQEESDKGVKWMDENVTDGSKEFLTIIPKFENKGVKHEVQKLKESDKTNNTFYISGDSSLGRERGENSILKVKTNTSVTEKQINSHISSLYETSFSKEEGEKFQRGRYGRREAKVSRSDSPNKRTIGGRVRASSLLPISSNSVFLSRTGNFRKISLRKKSHPKEEYRPVMIQFFMTEQPPLKDFHRESFELRRMKNNSKFHIRRKMKRLKKRRNKRKKKKLGLDFNGCEKVYRNTVVGFTS